MTEHPAGDRDTFEGMLGVVERLREPDGCPWDRVQTHASLRQYLLEECYEVLEALDTRDWQGLAEELGDLLVHIAFHADIARRAGTWTASDLFRQTSRKLVRRHPHVFEDGQRVDTAAEVVDRWEGLKRAERGAKRITESVPQALPALALAAALQRKADAARVPWRAGEPQVEVGGPPLDAIGEIANADEREETAGELLFGIVAGLRQADVDPETALRSATVRFRRRLAQLEEAAGDVPVEDLAEADRARLWSESALKETAR